jgi:hypothetical protein
MKHALWQNVEIHGIVVGRVVDVILDREHGDAIGFEVRCEDGVHRYLPCAAAVTGDRAIAIESPFALLDADELGFYRGVGTPIRGGAETAD